MSVRPAKALTSQTRPHKGWIEPLTCGFADGLVWDLELDPNFHDGDIGFWLYGKNRDGKVVFLRQEVLDYGLGSTLPGSFTVESELPGAVPGMGSRYVANLAQFLRDELNFSAMRMHAGDTVGGYFWARMMAALNPSAAFANERSDLIQHLGQGLRLTRDQLLVETHKKITGCIEALKNPSAPDAVNCLRVIAADRTPLQHSGELGTSERFLKAAQKYNPQPVPLGAYLLLGSHWHGIIRLDDDIQMSHLQTRAQRP